MIDEDFLYELLDPPRRIMKRINAGWYWLKCLIKPYNRVTMSKLPRSWCDRDYLMLHAMFQILVDFIELEQPFVSWDDQRPGRFKDVGKMAAFIEQNYGEGRENREEIGDEAAARTYANYNELLDLYIWYVTDQFEDPNKLRGETWPEYFKRCNEVEENVEQMLRRLLDVRKLLWT